METRGELEMERRKRGEAISFPKASITRDPHARWIRIRGTVYQPSSYNPGKIWNHPLPPLLRSWLIEIFHNYFISLSLKRGDSSGKFLKKKKKRKRKRRARLLAKMYVDPGWQFKREKKKKKRVRRIRRSRPEKGVILPITLSTERLKRATRPFTWRLTLAIKHGRKGSSARRVINEFRRKHENTRKHEAGRTFIYFFLFFGNRKKITLPFSGDRRKG